MVKKENNYDWLDLVAFFVNLIFFSLTFRTVGSNKWGNYDWSFNNWRFI